jgi:hypothetical protein
MRLLGFALIVCVLASLFYIVSGASGGEQFAFYRLREFGRGLAHDCASQLGPAAAAMLARPVYALAAALVLIGLMAVHDQARRGRVAAMPCAAAVWSLALVWSAAQAWRLFEPTRWPRPIGVMPALLLVGVVWLLIAAAVASVWLRWLRLRQSRKPVTDPGAARSLGQAGLVVTMACAGLLLFSAAGGMSVAPGGAGQAVLDELGLLRPAIEGSGVVGLLGALGVGAGLAGVGAWWMLGHGAQASARAVAAWCFGAALLCAFAAGAALDLGTIGDWSGPQALLALLLLGVILALTDATIGLWLRAPGTN